MIQHGPKMAQKPCEQEAFLSIRSDRCTLRSYKGLQGLEVSLSAVHLVPASELLSRQGQLRLSVCLPPETFPTRAGIKMSN